MDEAKPVEAQSIFGNFLARASQFGDNFLDFKLKSRFLDEEAALSQSLTKVANSQAAAAVPSSTGSSNNDLVKFGVIAVAGVIGLMVVAKALK